MLHVEDIADGVGSQEHLRFGTPNIGSNPPKLSSWKGREQLQTVSPKGKWRGEGAGEQTCLRSLGEQQEAQHTPLSHSVGGVVSNSHQDLGTPFYSKAGFQGQQHDGYEGEWGLLEMTRVAFNQSSNASEIDSDFSISRYIQINGLSTIFMSKGGDAAAANADFFQTKNFPCRSDLSDDRWRVRLGCSPPTVQRPAPQGATRRRMARRALRGEEGA
eukprot:171412-Rhodomonas_salina.1